MTHPQFDTARSQERYLSRLSVRSSDLPIQRLKSALGGTQGWKRVDNR